jgi:ppGpp synthetase/RelA/SpoT-type nucleotidyltranferase
LLSDALAQGLTESLQKLPHIDRIYFRVKEIDKFVKKAQRYDTPLIDIEDQVAGRVLVFFTSDVLAVSEAACKRWNVIEAVHKEPERDAEFGYESWHQVFVIPEHLKSIGWSDQSEMPSTFELQIRTLFMHAYAEPQHDFAYKSSAELLRDDRKRLGWIASAAWGADRAYQELLNQDQARSAPAD